MAELIAIHKTKEFMGESDREVTRAYTCFDSETIGDIIARCTKIKYAYQKENTLLPEDELIIKIKVL